MSDRTGAWLSSDVVSYVQDRVRPDPVRDWVTEQTAALGRLAAMQIGADQSTLMTLLTQLVGARFAVEVGTFTGTSSLAIARGLSPGGRLLCCDVSEEWTAVAREAWNRAGVADRVELRIGPAVETLRALPADTVIDLAFIDADKPGYLSYITEIVPRLRSGGLLLVDNTIWYGQVVAPTRDDDKDTAAIKAVNDAIAADDRLDSVIMTVGDGLTIARKR
jgi:caffeoyl-CoA O-methyltransferase